MKSRRKELVTTDSGSRERYDKIEVKVVFRLGEGNKERRKGLVGGYVTLRRVCDLEVKGQKEKDQNKASKFSILSASCHS